MPYRAALSRISHAKNSKPTPEDLYKQAPNPIDEQIAMVFEDTRSACATPTRSISTICCSKPCACCGTTPRRAKPGTAASSYVMIDEYQDTNRSQYQLMRLLTDRAR